MKIESIQEILNDNTTDYYYKTKNEIRTVIRCNEDICKCFNSIDELNDFIIYTDCMLHERDPDELEKIKNSIVVKHYFRSLYKLVEGYNDINILEQINNPLTTVTN